MQDSLPTAAVAPGAPRALRTRGCPRGDRILSVPASVHGTDPLPLRSPGWAARALSLLTPLSCPYSRHPRLGQHLQPPWGGVELRCAPGQRLRRRAPEQPRLPIWLTSDRGCSWWLSRSGVLENSGSASVRGRAPFNEPWRLGTARYVRSEFAGGPEALSTQRMDS